MRLLAVLAVVAVAQASVRPRIQYLKALSESELLVTWKESSANWNNYGYSVIYSSNDLVTNMTRAVRGDALYTIIHGLAPNTEYTVVVVLNADHIESDAAKIWTHSTATEWHVSRVGEEFIDQMKRNFDASLKHLFASFRMKGQALERPGLAKLLREESDRKWGQGLQLSQKFFQREGKLSEGVFVPRFRFQDSFDDMSTVLGPQRYSQYYVDQVDSLVDGSSAMNDAINAIYKLTNTRKDPDLAHFLQEASESERSSLRRFKLLQKNLQHMSSNGVALSLFDKSLE